MFMPITGIDLFDHNVGMVCAKGRLRCSWIALVLINLINIGVRHVPNFRLRCSCISLVLIYLITMWVWHVPKLDSDVHAYYLY